MHNGKCVKEDLYNTKHFMLMPLLAGLFALICKIKKQLMINNL